MGNYRRFSFLASSGKWREKLAGRASTGCLLMALVTLSFLVMTASLPPQFINVDF